MIKNKKTLIGHILAAFTILVWGTTFVATKILLEEFSPIEILVFRFTLGAIALFIVYPRIFKWTNWKHELYFFIASISGITIYQLLENIAIDYSQASNVSIIISCAAFFTAICSKIFLKDEKITKLFYLGFIVSMIGVVFVSINGNLDLNIFPLGDFIALLAAILWGLYGVAVKLVGEGNYHPIHVTRRIMFYSVLLLIPMALLNKSDLTLTRFMDIENLLLTLFLGLIASALCFLTWNIAVDYLGAVKSGLYVYFNPVVTIIFGVLILNEKLTVWGIVGTILILVGLYISTYKKKEEKNE